MSKAADLTFFEDKHTPGAVIAVSSTRRADGKREGFVSTYDRPNSPVSWKAVPESALGDKLTKEEARKRHPRLFEKVDE